MRCSNCAIKMDEYEEDCFWSQDGTDALCSQDCLDEFEDTVRDREDYDREDE